MFTKTDIEKYFLAEKQAGLLFIVIGAIALLMAIAFYFLIKTNISKGAAVPLLLIGLVQLVVGFTVFQRSDADRIRNVYAYDLNRDQLKFQELPRMKTVNQNFVVIRWVEIVLILVGTGLAFYYKQNPAMKFWYGLGITLAIQALLMLGLDYFAEKRAKIYTTGIENFLTTKTNG